jgi:DHA1 family bicyclomycin/chloramphenicol resistance-like MFS transporter
MAFISSSSYIYQDGFKLSSQVYSYYYALSALGMIAGPMVYVWLSRRFSYEVIISVDFAVTVVSGLMICIFGGFRPWLFAIMVLPCTIAGGCTHPPSINLMLEQQKGDSGSASSLINAFGTFMGSLGMIIVSFSWGNLLITVGVLYVIVGVFCGSLWLFICHKLFIIPFNV